MLTFKQWPLMGPRYRRLLVLIAVAAALTGMTGGFVMPVREVQVQVDEQSTIVKSRHRTVAGVLRAAGVTVGASDLVMPDMHERLKDTRVIRITRAVPVKLYYDGMERAVMLPVPAVTAILAQQGIALGSEDVLETNLAPASSAELYVRVSRVWNVSEVEQVEVPFTTRFREDPLLPRDARVVAQEGRPGLLERQIEVTYRDGLAEERKVVSENIVRRPQDKIVAFGVETAPHIGARSGERERTGREMIVEATGYSQSLEEGTADGITASGTRVRPGVVAVDPRVIPLGSTLWIEGYGYARAEDTGGAIKGERVDLFFGTRAEAFRWGRRTVKLYIME